MIGAVEAVRGVPAGVIAGQASATADRHQRRLRWLSALRAAQGEDEPRSERTLTVRSDIAGALAALEEARLEADDADLAFDLAFELGRRIVTGRDQALRGQARLGAAAVRRLLSAGAIR